MHRLVPVCPKPPCSPALGLSALGFWCNKITADAHVNSHYTGRKTEIQICQSYENVLHLKIAFGQRSLQTMRCVFTPHNDPFEQQKQNPYEIPWYCLVHRNSYMYIWSRFAVRYHPPPLPPHGMVPKPAFCSIPHENVVFAVFFAWWVAGAVRNPANSLDFCNQPSENVLLAMFRLRHRGVVPPRPLLFLCQIII